MSLPFPALETACVHWLWPTLIFKADNRITLTSVSVVASPLTILLPSFTFKDPCDYTEPTWMIQKSSSF